MIKLPFKPFSNITINIRVMENNLNHNEWMHEAPYLASLPKVSPFVVPDQYFESLNDRISAAVFVEELKAKAGVFEAEVPEGYFENLSAEINSRISLEALDMPKQDGFAVPDGYFEQLQANILSNVDQQEAPVKVVKLWSAKVAKYAAAASIVLISAFAIYFNQDKLGLKDAQIAKTSIVSDDPTLWDIDEDVIRDQMATDDSEQITNTSATSSELEDYIISHYSQSEIATNL
jgi:hypothetical protein